MSAKKIKSSDYKSLAAPREKAAKANGYNGLEPLSSNLKKNAAESSQEVTNLHKAVPENFDGGSLPALDSGIKNPPTYSEEQKIRKKEKLAAKDSSLISTDYWIARNGHTLTYVGLYLFSILVLFRPYELIPGLGFLAATAFYFAVATLLVFIPTQLSTEGNMTAFPTEVKCVLAMTFMALVTMPIGKDFANSWETFNDSFIKAVLMFIVMVNVLRTRRRLMGMVWLSLTVGVILSYMSLGMYMRGEFNTEGYRVTVDIGGIFGNANDIALHLVTMTPIAVCLGIAAKNRLMQILFFVMAILFVSANMVTYSRGGFLGLIVCCAVLAWKLGRKQRLYVTLVSLVVGGLVILLAPGNYGLRVLSIFIPGLDEAGSSDQRRELLFRSLFVTARNPWGIGIGNSPVMNDFNLQWHNAYTQVASELTVLGFAAYLIFLVSPFRKLGAIERTQESGGHDWFYYLSIGLQASIAGYMVSSFFVSVAYNWYAYYLIAYAVAFRRIYRLEGEGPVRHVSSPPADYKSV